MRRTDADGRNDMGNLKIYMTQVRCAVLSISYGRAIVKDGRDK